MTTCVPAASGVPGLSGPPDWITVNTQRDNLDDPRWRGAAAQGFPLTGGSTEHFSFRALSNTVGAATTLYLSFQVKVDPHFSNGQDRLYVGFRGPTGSMVLELTPYVGTLDPINSDCADISVYLPPAVVGNPWSKVAAESDHPNWIAASTRKWLFTSPLKWAVQMAVPVQSAGSIDADAGPNLGSTFRLWYFALVMNSAIPASYTRHEWKPGHTPTPVPDPPKALFPDPVTWDTFQLSSAGCNPLGIELTSDGIGTTNPVSSQILYATADPRPVNTLFARPRNVTKTATQLGTPVEIDQVKARFRIAQWGSVIADPKAPWEDITGGKEVPNGAKIPPIQASDPTPSTNPIALPWPLDDDDITKYITGQTPHRCMFVELFGPGLTFIRNSTYRNMDFVPASLFRREAEISIVGLAPISPAPRGVYLYVETSNMPSRVEQLKPAEEGPRIYREAASVDVLAMQEVPQVEPTFDEQTASLPTYRVHVYHDLGETATVDGVTGLVLRPQLSFGYFLNHSGALAGWRHSLTAPPEAQLEEIQPGFYKIVVPNDGSVKVVTEIEAVEPGLVGVLTGCWRRLLQALGLGTIGAALVWRLRR